MWKWVVDCVTSASLIANVKLGKVSLHPFLALASVIGSYRLASFDIEQNK